VVVCRRSDFEGQLIGEAQNMDASFSFLGHVTGRQYGKYNLPCVVRRESNPQDNHIFADLPRPGYDKKRNLWCMKANKRMSN